MFLFLLAYSYKINIESSYVLSCQYFMTYLYCNDQCEGTPYRRVYVWIVNTYSSDWSKCVNTSNLAKYDEDYEYLRVCPTPLPEPTQTPEVTPLYTPEVTPWKTPLYTLEMSPNSTFNIIVPTPTPMFTLITIEQPHKYEIIYLSILTLIILILLIIIIILCYQIRKAQKTQKEESSSSSVEIADVMLPQLIKDLHTIMVSDDPFQNDFDSSEPFELSDVLPH